MSACERHLDQRGGLVSEAEHGPEYEQRENAADSELSGRHEAGHDHVRTGDSPNRLERRQPFPE